MSESTQPKPAKPRGELETHLLCGMDSRIAIREVSDGVAVQVGDGACLYLDFNEVMNLSNALTNYVDTRLDLAAQPKPAEPTPPEQPKERTCQWPDCDCAQFDADCRAEKLNDADRRKSAPLATQPVAWMLEREEYGKPVREFMQDKVEAHDRGNFEGWSVTPLYAHPQPVSAPPGMKLVPDDRWMKLYRRAFNVAAGLTNYVEDRPELRRAEKDMAKLEEEARAMLNAVEK